MDRAGARRFLLPLLVAAVGAAACGGGSGDDSAPDALRRERAFLEAMAPHQHAGVELAEVAAEKARIPEVRRLAREMLGRQSRALLRLDRVHRRLFDSALQGDEDAYAELGLTASDIGPSHSHARLRQLRVSDRPDHDFLDRMIVHHRGAIRMARAVLPAASTDLRPLAEQILRDHRREVESLEVVRTLELRS